MKPTDTRKLFRGAVEVHCFGTASGNWALKGYGREGCEAYNPGIGEKIEGLLASHRIGRLYMPSPHRFNAELAGHEALQVSWKPGRIFRGVDAEGVVLDKIEDACGIASSDCPTIIVRHGLTGLVAAAHAGLKSLYDDAALFEDAPKRRYASVVDALVETLAPGGLQDAKHLEVYTVCGIGALSFRHPWDDPVYGDRNRKLCGHLVSEWGQTACTFDQISLKSIIARQFEARGANHNEIRHDYVDTAGPERHGDQFPWHSHRRDKDGQRNFVLTIRRR